MTTVSNPNYLFNFHNQQQNKDYLIYLNKLNTTSERFDLFEFIEGTDLTLPTGNYTYYIYQSEDLILDYENKLLLEVGKMNVLKEFPNNIYNTTNTINTVNYA